MKILTISGHQLELARTHLKKPFLTVGRSPSCDVLLRAPGVRAIHFLIEWIGSGEFSPHQGSWSIIDISEGRSSESEFGEGIVFSDEPVELSGFRFVCIEDRLESSESIGGGIAQSLESDALRSSEVLELIQVRTDSGAIEEVRHIPIREWRSKERILPQVEEFKIEWSGADSVSASGAGFVKILLGEMPGAEIFNRGHKMDSQSSCELKPMDLLRIRWRGHDFFVRLVDEVKSPAIARDVFGDPLLKRIFLAVGVLALLLLMMTQFFSGHEQKPEDPPLRVARVEVPKPAEPPKPVEPPKPPEPEKVQEAPKPKEVPPPPAKPKQVEQAKPKMAAKPKVDVAKKQDTSVLPQKNSGPAGQVAAPKFSSPTKTAPKAGLNSPAQVSDVNAVGILGALKKAGVKGKGVQANQIINDAIVTEAVTGAGSSQVVLKNPPTGTLGSGKSGSPQGKSADLAAASTTLSGIDKADPASDGPLAMKGGARGFNIGSSLNGDKNSNKAGLGSLDSSDFTVDGGGLDRETVRRVIASYRGQIRTCYERALLTQSSLEGRIVYDWRIGADGHVITAQMVKSTVESASLSSCVLDVIKQMIFPKSAGKRQTLVHYPFVFQGKK